MIKFIYAGDAYDKGRELILDKIFNIASEYINLPQYIEVEFRKLNPAIYGETLLERRFKNRIRLHEELNAKECIVPFVHELIHLNQIHERRLMGLRENIFLWEGKTVVSTIDNWHNQPWEIEVLEKQEDLLDKILSHQDLTNNTPYDILSKWKKLLSTEQS